METKSVRVRIFGTEYPLRGESEEMTKQVANYVDTMLRNVHDKIPDQPPLTIAVLSALNITEELFRERQGTTVSENVVEKELQKMIEFLQARLRL